jgi:two-component system sensor histidine kinase KdpD
LYDDAALVPSSYTHFVQRIIVPHIAKGHTVIRSLRLLPLQAGQRIVGVLRLQIINDPHHIVREEDFEENLEQPNTRTTFFWTFLEQATSLIERAELRRENMRIEILQHTDALRAALLSSVSHDLRTPLTSIKAAATSLLQEDVHWNEEARRGFAISIVRQADRLNRLVGNLLDMSRIEEGALRPEKEWYHLAELIYDVLDRLRPLLQDRVVHTQISGDLPPVELDYLHMDQVLTNLLENAVRYTPSDSPIEICAHQDDQRITLSVADRGPGIPSADLERIFDKFYRVLDDRTASLKAAGMPAGSGLGLAVCRGLVEAQGGHIWAEARSDGGAIFFITLPKGAPERIPV